MVDDFTRYTDTIISEVSLYFSINPEFRSRRTNKYTQGNFTPALHHIFLETQQGFAGLFTDFSDPEKVYKAFSEYVRLMAYVNSCTEFMPTRANFCAYIGISTSMYERLLRDSPQTIKDAMCYVEDYFVSLLQMGSLSGDVGVTAAKLVLQTAGQYGHNQVTVKEASDIRATERRTMSVEELESNLKRITSGGK